MPLTAMSDDVSGLENLKLVYGLGTPMSTPAAKAPAAEVKRTSTMPEQLTAIGQMFKSMTEGAATLFKKPEKIGKGGGGGDGGGGFQIREETPWTTYALIGGGVLLAGVAVYMIVKKAKKK